jgi:hypothetical protein
MELDEDEDLNLALESNIQQYDSLIERIEGLKAELSKSRKGLKGSIPVNVIEGRLSAAVEEKLTLEIRKTLLEKQIAKAALVPSLVPQAVTHVQGAAAAKVVVGRQTGLGAYGFSKTYRATGLTVQAKSVTHDDGDLFCRGFGKPLCKQKSAFKNNNGLISHEEHCKEACALRRELAARVYQALQTQPKPAILAQRVNSDEESDTDREANQAPQASLGRRGQLRRNRYSYTFKLRVLSVLDYCLKMKMVASQRHVADLFNLSESTISSWHKERDHIAAEAALARGKRGRGYTGRVLFSSSKKGLGVLWEAEALLASKIDKARDRGLTVGFSISRIWMRKCIDDAYANLSSLARQTGGIDTFRCSRNWFSRFLARHGYKHRRPTNKKAASVEDKLPKIRLWHRRLQHYVSQPGGANHPIYGRFAPGNILNVDQVGMNLTERSSKTTLAKHGQEVVRIATKKGSDKRFCTLQLAINLNTRWQTVDGVKINIQPQPPLAVIFRGTGARISAEERAAYHPSIHVYFQKNAWMDTDLQAKWVERTLKPYCTEVLQVDDPKLLVLDNLSCQTLPELAASLEEFNMERRLLPTDTTDNIQPIDQHIGVELKRLAGQELENDLLQDEEFAKEWLGIMQGTFPAWKTRVKVTHLLGRAYEKLCGKRDFLRTGHQTGCVMPKEGIDRSACGIDSIKIDGVPVYEFESIPPSEFMVAPAAPGNLEAAENESLHSSESDAPEPASQSSTKVKTTAGVH